MNSSLISTCPAGGVQRIAFTAEQAAQARSNREPSVHMGQMMEASLGELKRSLQDMEVMGLEMNVRKPTRRGVRAGSGKGGRLQVEAVERVG